MKTATKASAKSSAQKPAKKSASQTTTQSAASEGLRKFFEDQLKDIYWAEKALTKAIPKMIKKATSEELQDALTEHLEVTKQQVTRLEEVFTALDKKATAKKCEAMEGLIKEAEEIMSDTEGLVRDAGIIAAAQKVEHYEIASYGTLCALAKTLGESEVADLLEETLNEEKEADETLTGVAENTVNEDALNEEE